MWRKLSFDLSRYVTTVVRFSSVDLKTKLFEAQFEVILISPSRRSIVSVSG